MKESLKALSDPILQIREGLKKLENFAQGFDNTAGDEARWLIHTCPTGRFLLDIESLVDRTIRESDNWEFHQIDTLLKLVKKHYDSNYDLVFLDVGAYLGWYAVSILKSGLFAEIHAFEANPENFAQLNTNIMLNDALKAIHLHHCVVTNKPGNTPLNLPVRRSNRGWAEVGTASGFSADFEVNNVVLDELFSNTKGRFLVAKIDVEGHERQVLNGMMELMKNNTSLIQVELYQQNKSQIISQLEKAGFTLLDSIQEDYFFLKVLKD